MRVVKIAIALAVMLVLCVSAFIFVVGPALWKSGTRRDSTKALKVAQTEEQLREAVKPWGVFITAKDGSWVAIRYRDSHAGGILSLALAKDSGGEWFESQRHFCGTLPSYARRRLEYAANTNMLVEMFPVRTNRFSMPSYQQLEPVFSAVTLQALREALGNLGFKPMHSQ